MLEVLRRPPESADSSVLPVPEEAPRAGEGFDANAGSHEREGAWGAEPASGEVSTYLIS
jgi:hypothetical protein